MGMEKQLNPDQYELGLGEQIDSKSNQSPFENMNNEELLEAFNHTVMQVSLHSGGDRESRIEAEQYRDQLKEEAGRRGLQLPIH